MHLHDGFVFEHLANTHMRHFGNAVKSNESIEFAVFRILQEKRKTTGA